MSKNVLITGGAGFIGSHLADELISKGFSVRILDNLSPQVHGNIPSRPAYLSPSAELIKGDVRNHEEVREALEDIDVVYHFAARVGVGQSMYEIHDYVEVNNVGTAILLEEIINRRKPLHRLVVASSMSIYGEGLYQNGSGNIHDARRVLGNLKAGLWEMKQNGHLLDPCPTPETKKPNLSSVYALSKYDQERLCLLTGQAYNIPVVALRFFNVYGTRQALSNPYTGVLAIFASRLLNEKPPVIFEDGYQQRDFVSVYDVVQACRLAMESDNAIGEVFNVGSGKAYTVRSIAEMIAAALNKKYIAPIINEKYRVGDIRHCFADITKARKMLGYQPAVKLEDGLKELAQWLEDQIAYDFVDQATSELDKRGLTI